MEGNQVDFCRTKKVIAEQGYKPNPVPPSKRLTESRHMAARLYEDFTGHRATRFTKELLPDHDAYLQVGKVDAILYTTNRSGKVEHYKHDFRRESRPLLIASPDGKELRMIRGSFVFTNRGIVDHDAAGNPVE